MNVIIDNPFRILGLLSNSSERDLQRQLSRLKAYANVGKSTSLDYDFNFLGELNRELQNISDAASKIEQAKSRVHYSLFWFSNTNQFDEIALTHLKQNDHLKAFEVWNKVVKSKEITSKNFSNALNLASLQLSLNTCNGKFDLDIFTESLRLKGEIITSDLFSEYVSLVAGEAVSINKEAVVRGFVDEIIELIKPKLGSPKGISHRQFIESFNSFPRDIRQYVISKFTDRPINSIENHIAETKNLRDEFPEEAVESGETLIQNTKDDLQFLKNLLPENDLQFQIVSNKLANELLQCSIDYFNELREDDEIDPGERSLKLARYAHSISAPGQIKDRIEETKASLADWVGEKPKRQKMKAVKDDLNFIVALMEELNGLDDVNGIVESFSVFLGTKDDDTVTKILEIVKRGKPSLKLLKKVLGGSDEFYLKISSAFCHNALNKLIDSINKTMKEVAKTRGISVSAYDLGFRIAGLQSEILGAIEAMFMLSTLDAVKEVKSQLQQNFTSLKMIANQIGVTIVDPRKEMEYRIKEQKTKLKTLGFSVQKATMLGLAEEEMKRIKRWRFFKNKEKNDRDIKKQQQKIDKLMKEAEQERSQIVREKEKEIAKLEAELKDY